MPEVARRLPLVFQKRWEGVKIIRGQRGVVVHVRGYVRKRSKQSVYEAGTVQITVQA